MINFQTYKNTLLSSGGNISQVKRHQSDDIINITFRNDPTYKRVLVLTDDGWKSEDAKYQKHTTPSILKDNVDYYLQFRPKTHYKIGTYVIIPDDASPEINTPENPFEQPVSERTQWWLIVGRTDANAYVRYSVLKCNWNFQWVYNGRIQSVFGCIRNANSYTSGVWSDNVGNYLDNLTGAWVPDIPYTYKNYTDFGLCDTRTLSHEMRFFITNNPINPKIYEVTKVVELVPEGIVKLSIKQDELDSVRDNRALMICNYYDGNGKPLVEADSSNNDELSNRTVTIRSMQIAESGELDYHETIDGILHIAKISYYGAVFTETYDGKVIWDLDIVHGNESLSEDDRDYYIGLLQFTDFEDGNISIKPSKAKSLIGKRFALTVSDEHGECSSTIELEVADGT